MSGQSEQQEVKVTGGIGALAFAMIPAALGGAALMWLGFVTGCMDIQQQRTLAQRMDSRVGVVEPLKNPVKLIIHQPNCFKVERAFADGNSITAYIRNSCPKATRYCEWHADVAAPDGTIINQPWGNSLAHVPAGAVIEQAFDVGNDNRASTITVWAKADLEFGQ